MRSKWYRGGLIGLALGLGGVIWWLLKQPLPDPILGGLTALGLGAVLALLITSFWRR